MKALRHVEDWDWWGYLGSWDTAYPIHGGAQVETIMNMVGRLDG
jgi:hypothetical protein